MLCTKREISYSSCKHCRQIRFSEDRPIFTKDVSIFIYYEKVHLIFNEFIRFEEEKLENLLGEKRKWWKFFSAKNRRNSTYRHNNSKPVDSNSNNQG